MPKRILQGTVVSDKNKKTVIVEVERRFTHPLFGKTVRRSKRYHAHDEQGRFKSGDVVRIQECRPMSKDKRWRVVEILTRGDVADVAPQTIGQDIERTAQVAPKSEVQE